MKTVEVNGIAATRTLVHQDAGGLRAEIVLSPDRDIHNSNVVKLVLRFPSDATLGWMGDALVLGRKHPLPTEPAKPFFTVKDEPKAPTLAEMYPTLAPR